MALFSKGLDQLWRVWQDKLHALWVPDTSPTAAFSPNAKTECSDSVPDTYRNCPAKSKRGLVHSILNLTGRGFDDRTLSRTLCVRRRQG